jgi:hypothetical protein
VRLPRLAVVLGLAASLVSAAPTAVALDLGEYIPGLKLTPFFTERMTYETNVFQVPSNSQADAIFKTIPGFLADYTFGPHSATLGYRAEILNYLTLTSQDTVNHAAVAQLRLDFPKTLLNIRDDFVKTTDPPNSELTGPIASITNVLAPEAEYRITNRLAVGANYSWTYVRFPNNDQVADDLDRDEHLYGASVFWKIRPKADIRLNYNYGNKFFSNETDRDVTRHQVLVAVRGDLTAKLSSTFRIGLEKRDPDSSFQPGYFGPIMGGDFVYRPTERTTLTLITDRSVQESTFGDVPFFVTTSGAFGVQQVLWNKFTASLRGTIGQSQYPSKQTLDGQTDWRNDLFYAYGVGLDYEIQPWITVGIEYLHIGRHSNFNQFDFQDDKFTAKVLLQF